MSPIAPIIHAAAAIRPNRVNALRCTYILFFIFLRLLLGIFVSLQRLLSATHERLCRLLALPPCQTYGPSESAVVIVGGDDDRGRHVALSFSELGYTVFALVPDRQPASSTTGGGASASAHPPRTSLADASTNVSSVLIQEWHQRIKKSGHSTSPWGLVAPIVLDMAADAQRTRAFETVDAYCATHSLQLVAVIVLPGPVPIPNTTKQKQTSRAGLNVSAWAEAVRTALVEPISIVQDYTGLLAAASGRVVLLESAAQHQPWWRPSLHQGLLFAAAQHLRQELVPLRIRVSVVSSGPSPSAPMVKSTGLTDRSETGLPAVPASQERGGDAYSVRNTIEDVLAQFTVRDEDVCGGLQAIVRSRYPRKHYVVGLHATLQAAYESMPTLLHLCLQSIARHIA